MSLHDAVKQAIETITSGLVQRGVDELREALSREAAPLQPTLTRKDGEPLTQAEIAALWFDFPLHVTDLHIATEFVRDVERLHGIGVPDRGAA